MSCNNINSTITYDEEVEGWTSFHSFEPDYMLGLNNKFFSFKNGNLYRHHSDNVDRNTYYEVSSPSRVSIMVNDSPSDIKELLAISLEGNDSWETLIRAYVSNSDDYIESSIKSVEFVKKEGIWYAYARRNESLHYDSKSTYGIGTVSSISGLDITVNGGNTSLCVGDSIIKGSDLSIIGTITNVQGNIITLSNIAGLNTLDYVLGMKDSRIEGGNLRGYTIRVDLENSNYSKKVELFSVNSEVIKSFS
jgi:hypothetical protein